MVLMKRKKPTDLADRQSGVRLTRGDLATILRYVRASSSTEAEVLRMLIHEAIIAREQAERGTRDSDEKYRKLQREAVSEEVTSLTGQLAEMHKILRWQSGMLDRVLQQSCYGAGLSLRNIQLSHEVALIVREDLLGATLKAEGTLDEEIKIVKKELREASHQYGHQQLTEVQEMYLDEIGKRAAAALPSEA
jgi:hypothetical protein